MQQRNSFHKLNIRGLASRWYLGQKEIFGFGRQAVGGRLMVGIGLGDFGVAKWGMRPVLMRPVLAGAGLLAGLLFSTHASAQSATWLASPGSGDFNTAANWSPAVVPTGTASFGFSNTTALSFSADTSIGGFTLNPGASAYNFTVGAGRTVSFTGAGITINGGSATFTNAFIVNFDNASTAGNQCWKFDAHQHS
jgi:hypothetical protein